MNRFRENVFSTIKNVIRTALWVTVAANCGIVAYYSVWFVLYFCSFSWRWVVRVMFSGDW